MDEAGANEILDGSVTNGMDPYHDSLPRRIRFESDGREEGLLDHIGGEFDLFGRDCVALPELEGEAFDRRLVSDGAHDEAAVGLQIVVLKKLLAALKRQVSAVDEIFVEAITLRVDVIDFILVAPINNEQHMRQRVARISVDAR